MMYVSAELRSIEGL